MASGPTGVVHAIGTRLGIGVYDEGWFEHRLNLFETITLPSMTAQTEQGFAWMLGVDPAMPPVARARLESVVEHVPTIALVPVEFKTDFTAAFAAWARRRATEAGADRLLTSRLDDDDALAVDAVERLRTEADACATNSPHRFAVFSFNTGSMWLPHHRRAYTRYHDSIGIGLSLLEDVDGAKSVYSRPHQQIKHRLTPQGCHTRSIEDDRIWWLYAAHAISDSETGDGSRHRKILDHKFGYAVDDDMLAGFGLDPERIDRLALIGEPTPAAPTKFLSLRSKDVEKEIKRLRQRRAGSVLMRPIYDRRIARLERTLRDGASRILA